MYSSIAIRRDQVDDSVFFWRSEKTGKKKCGGGKYDQESDNPFKRTRWTGQVLQLLRTTPLDKSILIQNLNWHTLMYPFYILTDSLKRVSLYTECENY